MESLERVKDFLTIILAKAEVPMTPARLLRVLFLVDFDLVKRGAAGSGAGWTWWPAGPWSTDAWSALESLISDGSVVEVEEGGKRVLRLGDPALSRELEVDSETARQAAKVAKNLSKISRFSKLDEEVRKVERDARKLGLLSPGSGG